MFFLTILAITFSTTTAVAANQIVHDAEYYILKSFFVTRPISMMTPIMAKMLSTIPLR